MYRVLAYSLIQDHILDSMCLDSAIGRNVHIASISMRVPQLKQQLTAQSMKQQQGMWEI